MKLKTNLLVLNLVLVILLGGCYPYTENPVLKDWPDYVPAQENPISFAGMVPPTVENCSVNAMELIGAWVAASSPETDPFSFIDIFGKQCQGIFEADILPLFSQANLWYAGAPSCRTCHGPDVQVSYGRLDLSSYKGILAGSSRESSDTTGEDILGGGNWQASALYDVLSKGEMPPSQPVGANPSGLVVSAGR